MIISRTPYRISFFGGGTDYPAWCKDNEGAVLSTTIDKYCYISVRNLPPFFPHKHRVVYSKVEEVGSVGEILHPVVKATLDYFKIDKGLEIHHDGDLPAKTGLGTSSSFTVGLIHALYALDGKMPSKSQLAKEAVHVERNILKENVGTQDQVAAACGGFNKIYFTGTDDFSVQPITVEKARMDNLNNHLMLFFTGFSRFASDIAKDQIENTPGKAKELNLMRKMVDDAVGIINNGDILDFGKMLDETWQLKKSLSNKISNPEIDNIYQRALNSGASGGKILGAGGGGFILFFVEPLRQESVRKELKELLEVPFRFENGGSQIIYYNPQK